MTDALDSLIDQFQPGPATPVHAERLKRFRDDLLAKNDRTSSRGVEVKTEDVTHSAGRTYAYIVVGSIGDEGTAASIFCRDARHICIGERGGVKLMNPKRKPGTPYNTRTLPKGWWNALWALT